MVQYTALKTTILIFFIDVVYITQNYYTLMSDMVPLKFVSSDFSDYVCVWGGGQWKLTMLAF